MKKSKKLLTVATLVAFSFAVLCNNTIVVNATELTNDNQNIGMEGIDILDNSLETNVVQPNVKGTLEEKKEVHNFGISTLSEAGHNTADTALYIDNSYMGYTLQDAADAYENWYYFYADEGMKISALLQQPENGDYDLYLYEYEDGTISLVSYSINTGVSLDNVSYISAGGYYFLRTVPVTADSSVLNVAVNLISDYDENEPNDGINYGTRYNDYINTNGTIDNAYDQDWMILESAHAGYYRVELNNVPSNAQYAVYIFNSNFEYIAGMLSSNKELGYVELQKGTNYILVESYNGISNSEKDYNLTLLPAHSVASTFKYTHGGKLVEITEREMYINGATVDFKWEFLYDINYIRYQQVTTTSETMILASSYENGSFSDAQNINRSDDCIKIKINNFNHFYYCYDSGIEETFTELYKDYEYIYIDANTGKAIGSGADIYLDWVGFDYAFNPYDI